MGALPGEHYCADHQGNHSHYAKENCVVCKQNTENERLRAALEFYGEHSGMCEKEARGYDAICSCGLDAKLKGGA